MRETIKRLQALQELDVIIHSVKLELESQPKRKTEIETRIKKKNEELEKSGEQLKNLESRKGDQEKVLFIEQEKYKKIKARLTGMNARAAAYNANQKEIEKQKKENEALEAELLEIMEGLENTKKSMEKFEGELKELSGVFETTCAEVDRIVASYQAELEQHFKKRKELTIGIEPPALSAYERINGHFPGSAVKRAVNEMCTGCHMYIPPQLYNEIQRGDKMISCPACQRILFFRAEEEIAAEALANGG